MLLTRFLSAPLKGRKKEMFPSKQEIEILLFGFFYHGSPDLLLPMLGFGNIFILLIYLLFAIFIVISSSGDCLLTVFGILRKR